VVSDIDSTPYVGFYCDLRMIRKEVWDKYRADYCSPDATRVTLHGNSVADLRDLLR
jgi:hypothetical protein